MIVHLDEVPQAVREAFPDSFAELCHSALWETVSLLIRQQFQRMDQIFAQALRYRMRFEDLRLLNSFPCLKDQKPVRLLPIVLFSTNRTPPASVLLSSRDSPNIIFQGETVAVRAKVRHCDTSLSSDGRNDSPQVVRTFEHDLLHNAHLFCLVLCYQAERLFYPVEGPS